jgi:hypothetical protein
LLKRFMRRASSSSRIVQLLYEVKQNRASTKESSKKNPEAEQKTVRNRKQLIQERGLDTQVYHPTLAQDWEEAWNITETLILMLRDEVELIGAEFLVVTLSNGIQVHPDPVVRASFMDSEGIDNLFYPDERIWEVCKQAGIAVMNLAKPFQLYAEQNSVCLHGFSNATICGGHWNEKGHFLAGRLISDEICGTGAGFMR